MSILRKVKKVERLYQELEKSTNLIKTSTGLHCLSGCGQCCTKPDIYATPLEFLPYAWRIFCTGDSTLLLDNLASHPGTLCIIFKSLGQNSKYKLGTCTEYAYRGMICRLFGYAVRHDKNGNLQLAACKVMKENTPKEVHQATEILSENRQTFPVFANYYRQLQNIDPALGSETFPINEAIRYAVLTVENYYAYRRFPNKYKVPKRG